MRKITDTTAVKEIEHLSRYLTSQCIDNELRPQGEDATSLWIIDDDQMTKSKKILRDFLDNPESSNFNVENISADGFESSNRSRGREPAKDNPARVIDVRSEIFERSGNSIDTSITLYIIIFCCISTLLYWNQIGTGFVSKLVFANYEGIPEIRSGEIWRLVTPIFLHGDFLHLLFNMMWMHQLGTQIEKLKGGRYYVGMIIIFAVLCNFSQYLVSGPRFLGMSGVIYGFLGYIWMHTKFSYRSNFNLNEQTVYFMGGWLLICLTGIVGNVANTQHVVGMISGTAWGFYTSGGMQTWIRQRSHRNGNRR